MWLKNHIAHNRAHRAKFPVLADGISDINKLFFPQLAEIKEIRVFNACGKLVKTMTGAGELTVQELPNGPYYLQVTTAGQTHSTTIIKIDP